MSGSNPVPSGPSEGRPGPRFDVTAVRDEGAFAEARRHSRLVRMLRVGLPAIVVLGTAAFVGSTYLGSAQQIDFSNIKVDPNGVVMEQPNVSGFQNNGLAYRLQAERAVQDNANPDFVTLETVDALIGLSATDNAQVDAGRGVYDTKGSTIALTGGIVISTGAGLTARMDEANVNLNEGTVLSSRPVEIDATEGRISADSMEMRDGGRRMVFRGTVRMTFTPAAASPPAQAAAAAP